MGELKSHLEETISNNHLLNTLCSYYDENDERKLIENTFLKLYVYNEYTNDIFNTDKLHHFKNILSANGFILTEEGEPNRIIPDTRENMTELIEEITNELFDEFLRVSFRQQPKFEQINTHLDLLGLTNKNTEILETYKHIIMNKYEVIKHFDVLESFMTTEYC